MTIAVAHHDSPEGRAALLHAAGEAEFQHAALAVLHVLTDGGLPAERLRQEVGDALRDAGYARVEWSLHTAPDVEGTAAALVSLTEQVAADLLIVGSRRRTPIGKFLLGSTVQRVVLDAPVPVLVVKAPLG